MNSETHQENNKNENVQATDTGPQRAATEDISQTQQSDAAANAQPADTASVEQKAYVDPSIAAEAKIADLEDKIAQMQDKYVRAIAENENLRKRTEREKSDIAKYAVTKFAGDMVAIADNLRRAIAAASASGLPEEQSGPLKALLEGVDLTDQELQNALEKNGIRPISANGEIFDPHKHQAVMEQDNPSVPAGTILQVFQDGYQIEDRVLRPSMVVVAKGGSKTAKAYDAVDKTPETKKQKNSDPTDKEHSDKTMNNDNISSSAESKKADDKADGSSSST